MGKMSILDLILVISMLVCLTYPIVAKRIDSFATEAKLHINLSKKHIRSQDFLTIQSLQENTLPLSKIDEQVPLICKEFTNIKVVVEIAMYNLYALTTVADDKSVVPYGEDYFRGELYGKYNLL